MDYTRYLRQALHNHWIGGSAYSAPATIYVALFTSATDIDGGGTEVAAGDYARVGLTNNATNFPNADANGQKSNGAIVDFGTTASAWGTVTHFALFDALTGGNMLAQDALVASKTINNGDPVSFPIGNITSTLT